MYDGKELVHESDVQHTKGKGDGRLAQWREQVRALIEEKFGCSVDGVVQMPRELCPLCREENENTKANR